MEIQGYCNDCQHRFIPATVKEKFNKYSGRKTFISCPERDKKVVGCLIKKNVIIDWNEFAHFLEERNELTKTEKKNLIIIGIYSDIEDLQNKD